MSGIFGTVASNGGALKDFTFLSGGLTNHYNLAGVADSAAPTAASFSINVLYATPFVAPRRGGTISNLAFYHIINATAGGAARIGIYKATSETNPYPGALISGSASIAIDSGAGAVRTHTANKALIPGWMYWLAILFGTNVAASGIRGLTVGTPFGLGTTATDWTLGFAGLTVAQAFGAMPDPFTAGATAITAPPIPALGYLFSA